MTHVFLDSSVILAFSRSFTGGSAFILECCEKGLINGYVSEKVIFESRKNALEDMGDQAVKAIEYVFAQGFLTVIPDCTEIELDKAHKAINNPKDELIIASAKNTKRIQYIISLDNGFFKLEVKDYVKPENTPLCHPGLSRI